MSDALAPAGLKIAASKIEALKVEVVKVEARLPDESALAPPRCDSPMSGF
jgi:hypothetical protein